MSLKYNLYPFDYLFCYMKINFRSSSASRLSVSCWFLLMLIHCFCSFLQQYILVCHLVSFISLSVLSEWTLGKIFWNSFYFISSQVSAFHRRASWCLSGQFLIPYTYTAAFIMKSLIYLILLVSSNSSLIFDLCCYILSSLQHLYLSCCLNLSASKMRSLNIY